MKDKYIEALEMLSSLGEKGLAASALMEINDLKHEITKLTSKLNQFEETQISITRREYEL